jgi:hypothetical protein
MAHRIVNKVNKHLANDGVPMVLPFP